MRCAAHGIKIRARVRCAMCTFLYRSLLKPRDSLGWWMTVEKPSAPWATIFSVFSTIQGITT